MGTGWGALSETFDFLTRLTASEEKFPSPTDFIGSVHNAPAGQIAILFGATGANITTSGGDYSFEQALIAADLMTRDTGQSALVVGADQGHPELSPLLDPSISPTTPLADGGGAFIISKRLEEAKYYTRAPFYSNSVAGEAMAALTAWCGGEKQLNRECGLILAGIPAHAQAKGEDQLEHFLATTGHSVPVVRYRTFIGEFASASAVAAVTAVALLENGQVPGALIQRNDIQVQHKKILVLGLGNTLSAMEFALQ